MQKNSFAAFLVPLFLGAILIILALLVFQLNSREEQTLRQTSEIHELAAGTDRLRSDIQKLTRLIEAGGARAASAPAESVSPSTSSIPSTPSTTASAARKWLHPEVDNFLKPYNFVMTPPDARSDGTLVRPYGSDPKGFNLLTENAADLGELIAYYCAVSLADRQAYTDPNLWYGQAAERVEITDDGKEFTLYLRAGIKWRLPGDIDVSDPKYAWLRGDHLLTARDVKFSLDMLMNPQVENGFAKNYYEDLDSWKVIDDHTIVIRWKKKLYGNIENTLSIALLPEFFYAYDEDGARFPDETLGLKFNQHWYNNKGLISAGPYYFAHYEPGVEIRLERNEDYYGEKPAVKTLAYPIYTDPDLTLRGLKAHKLSVGGLRPSQYRDEIRQWESKPKSEWPPTNPFLNGDILHKKYTAIVFYYLGWNMDKPLLKDKLVRRAMTEALNRQGIIDNVFEGLGRVATGPFMPDSPYNDFSIQPWPYDLDQARELLKQAGWEDSDGDGLVDKALNPGDPKRTPFRFSLLIYDSSPEYATMANIYKDDLIKIGVQLNIEAAEWNLMQEKMDNKEFDCYTGGWALSWDDDPYQIWHSSQADIPKGSNRVGFRNKEADKIIETLRVTFDHEERVRLFHQLHRILHDEQPYTFFRVPDAIACWWKEVKNVIITPIRPQTGSLPWWVDTAGR
ncbi:MAG: ABC transporter substrate-binding protein [Candidatus Sumerlaeota bacterium]|nr:ABC transporter substrate-binding protein [Candidatus Sumerlaeota bacterium]